MVNQLTQRVAEAGIPVNLLCIKKDNSPVKHGIELSCVPVSRLGRRWGWSPHLKQEFVRMAISPEVALFHLHCIWSAPAYLAAKVARQEEVPFVVSAHGMLEPWLWNNQGWKIRVKKMTYWWALAYPALRFASKVHAITPMERDHLRKLFPSSQIDVIPNAIDLDEYQDVGVSEERQKLILFLGRIEPKKGVDILLRGFAAAKLDKDWKVVVAGPVWSHAYQAQLEKIVAEFNLGDRVTFVGPVFGNEKLHLLRTAWIMAVPSHSEVVGLVNLEAAALRLPSITTHQTGLYDWELGGGMLIQPCVADMRKALECVCSWSDSEREERGLASWNLVNEKYSWKAALPMWMSLYSSLASSVGDK
jgi:glycosyltransferase involved in cell wall biosynthesis